MAKAPDHVHIGCRWSDKIIFKEDEYIRLQFGKGDRDRAIRYKIQKIRKNKKGEITYMRFVRG